ncbi:sensor histidine kinase [Parafrigoribacterium soli]|uniref:sensor histidine kinase n=1 Tax=Parafrigoribacterium soli TaxID=3144663 RepID=UPI0032EAD054
MWDLSAAPSGVWGNLTRPGARRWYAGSLVGLTWLVISGADLFAHYPGAGDRAIILLLLVLFAVVFAVVPPVNWMLPARFRLLPPTVLFALSFSFLPWLGWGVYSLWTYVGVAVAMSMVRMRWVFGYVAALTLTAVIFELRDGVAGDALFALPAVIASVSLMMAAFARQIQSTNQLRATQHEMARLAVEQERSRVGRDMHDILGHSLTVITVKAELAGALIESDPARAGREIAEVEELARGALADVRATVAGFRGTNVAAELANARTALEAAGIRAELPGSVDDVPAKLRELFGWVIREGVTNVVRHSGATVCSVVLGASFVEVLDDGRGPAADSRGGTGLAGLHERIAPVGARMTIGRSPSGGFSLRVSL